MSAKTTIISHILGKKLPLYFLKKDVRHLVPPGRSPVDMELRLLLPEVPGSHGAGNNGERNQLTVAISHQKLKY